MDYFENEELFVIPETGNPRFYQLAEKEETALLILIAGEEFRDELLALLQKICASVGYEFKAEVSLLSMDQFEQISVAQLFGIANTNTIISFGLHEDQLHTQFHKIKYQWLVLNDQKILFSDSLTNISTNQSLKMKLWQALKSM